MHKKLLFLFGLSLILLSCSSTRYADTGARSFQIQETESFNAAFAGIEAQVPIDKWNGDDFSIKANSKSSPTYKAVAKWAANHGHKIVDSLDSMGSTISIQEKFCGTNLRIKEKWVYVLLAIWTKERTIADIECKYDLKIESLNDSNSMQVAVDFKNTKTVKEESNWRMIWWPAAQH